MTTLTPFYEKKGECILCKASFTTTKIRSSFVKVDKYDRDFRPIYEKDEMNPLLYNVFVCPHCGFSYTEDFSKYFPPGSKEELELKVRNQWTSRDFGKNRTPNTAINTYKLAVYCGEIKNEKKVTIGGLLLRIAWIYRSLHNEEQEIRFMQHALKQYMESYSIGDYQGSKMSEMKLTFVIAELLYRVNDKEQAVLYLSKVIEKQSTTTERTIVEMARDRWSELREELQKNKVTAS